MYEFLGPLAVAATAGMHLLGTVFWTTAGAVGAKPQLPAHPAVEDKSDARRVGPSHLPRQADPRVFPRTLVDHSIDADYGLLLQESWRAARLGKHNPDRWANAERSASALVKYDSPQYYAGDAPALFYQGG